ncbi:putative tpa: zn 2cys6 transcription factor protein [Eutypa lata UCREL1]|uniref:Putative tpa: zn 2cys6 transcription factor protein n=1 Tax=Eutypa lata (strain UCR-EL1) TaxID=1287681 RepID=M7SWF3_EUTLA|nr:putative tpa: zn 2cys6 transcription factor protein [Eutypa lata UCREL1]
MSLYTGRLPVVTVVPPTFTLNSLDDSAEQEIWSPYYGNSLSLTNIAPYQFPYMKSHVVSAFSNSLILAYRPFWSITEYYQNCISAARSIEKLLVLFESAFGFENISYLMGYCIYTGASVMLEHTKKGQDGANNTMRTFLRALQAGSRRCPLLERSLNIVIRSLQPSGIQRPPIVTGSNPATTATTHTRAHTPYYLPAFPQLEHQDVNANLDGFEGGGGGFGDQQGFTGSSSMLFLDCYPEMQLNLGDFAPSQVQM